MHKIVKGSFIVIIGNIIFRIGGYIYRVLMQYLLGVSGYGTLSLVLSFQGILILIAAAGLPPAIAKFVSEYLAKKDKKMVKQVIITSAKIMIPSSIIISILFFYLAKYLAASYHLGADETALFQIVSVITPFSVILGLFRGVFQGYQNMTYILITRVVEQIFMISIAVILIIAGFGIFGAIIGSIIGFGIAALSAFLIFKNKISKELNDTKQLNSIKEFKLAKKLLIFSVPIIITGLSELAMFDTGNYIIPLFMDTTALGYYNIVSPISRLPLIISSSVAISMLPAASEAISLNKGHLIEKYVVYSYRYMLLVILPLSAIIMLFAKPILAILFPKAPLAYAVAGSTLSLLIIGITLFSIYVVSSSIFQGLGKSYPPMTFLIVGSVLNLTLTTILVPNYGLNGAALSTIIACFVITVISTWKLISMTKAKLPLIKFSKILLSSILVSLVLLLIPKTIIGLILGILITPFIYIGVLGILGCLENRDIILLNKLAYRLGPLTKYFIKINRIIEIKFVK